MTNCIAVGGKSVSTSGMCFGPTMRELVALPPPNDAHVLYHSLVAEPPVGQGVPPFRETVVFHDEFVYPSYLVAYQRVRHAEADGA